MDRVAQLLTVQDHDRKIIRLVRESQDIPKRKEDIESRLAEHREAVRQAQEDVKRHTLNIRELDGEVEGLNQKAARFREQQMMVKSNEDFRALGREINATNRQIRSLEDKELELMEEMEQLSSAVTSKMTALNEEERVVKEEVAALDRRLAEIEGEVAALKSKRPGLADPVDGAWLARYERILQHRGDFAVVGIERGVCMGCHMTLPPQQVHDARKRDTLTTCSFCGRILFVETP